MASKNSIAINTVDTHGKKLTKTVTDINPAATNAQLKTFAEGLNALTTNTYVSTNRIDREEIAYKAKTAPTVTTLTGGISLTKTSMTITEYMAWENVPFIGFSTNSDGEISIASVPQNAAAFVSTNQQDYLGEFTIPGGENGYALVPVVPANDPTCLGDFVVKIGETDTYAAGTFTFSVTAG